MDRTSKTSNLDAVRVRPSARERPLRLRGSTTLSGGHVTEAAAKGGRAAMTPGLRNQSHQYYLRSSVPSNTTPPARPRPRTTVSQLRHSPINLLLEGTNRNPLRRNNFRSTLPGTPRNEPLEEESSRNRRRIGTDNIPGFLDIDDDDDDDDDDYYGPHVHLPALIPNFNLFIPPPNSEQFREQLPLDLMALHAQFENEMARRHPPSETTDETSQNEILDVITPPPSPPVNSTVISSTILDPNTLESQHVEYNQAGSKGYDPCEESTPPLKDPHTGKESNPGAGKRSNQFSKRCKPPSNDPCENQGPDPIAVGSCTNSNVSNPPSYKQHTTTTKASNPPSNDPRARPYCCLAMEENAYDLETIRRYYTEPLITPPMSYVGYEAYNRGTPGYTRMYRPDVEQVSEAKRRRVETIVADVPGRGCTTTIAIATGDLPVQAIKMPLINGREMTEEEFREIRVQRLSDKINKMPLEQRNRVVRALKAARAITATTSAKIFIAGYESETPQFLDMPELNDPADVDDEKPGGSGDNGENGGGDSDADDPEVIRCCSYHPPITADAEPLPEDRPPPSVAATVAAVYRSEEEQGRIPFIHVDEADPNDVELQAIQAIQRFQVHVHRLIQRNMYPQQAPAGHLTPVDFLFVNAMRYIFPAFLMFPDLLSESQHRVMDEISERRLEVLNRICAVRDVRYRDIGDRCVICQCEFESTQMLRTLLCGHKYHLICIDTWCRTALTCPVCRRGVDGQIVSEETIRRSPPFATLRSLEFIRSFLVMRRYSYHDNTLLSDDTDTDEDHPELEDNAEEDTQDAQN
ncbi:hypothetical protein Trydic_g5062 [Trypoxylus dichotomus]